MVAMYSKHGRLPSERARKQCAFLCDLCELVERDKLEATTILDGDGDGEIQSLLCDASDKEGEKYSLSIYSDAILGIRVLPPLYQAHQYPVSDSSGTCCSE